MSNTKNNIDLLKDESFKELMYWTAKAQVGVSDVSVNLAKKHLLNNLLLDVKKINVDEASLVKIKIWLESHRKQLGKLGYHFEAPTLDGGDGEYSMPLSYGSGTFNADYSENSYGEFKESDGISDHIEGGVSLQIDVMSTGTGKSIMNAQVVRNADKG